MHVLILGSGVIGVCSAWYLARNGHQVTVIDRQSQAGEETSFANAGQLSYGYSSPWAAPGIPRKAMKWLFEQHAPLKLSSYLSPSMWQWLLKMLHNCEHRYYQQNKSRMLRVSRHSQYCLAQLKSDLDLSFDHRQRGTLQLFRNHEQVKAVTRDVSLFKEAHTRFDFMDMSQCLALEPALARVEQRFVGGLHFPDDGTGDCFRFTQALAEKAREQGVRFVFDTQVERLEHDQQSISGVITNRGQFQADHYVVAMGSYSPALLKPLKLPLPVYPVKGYSLTVPIKNAQSAPQSTVMDESYKVAVTRFEQRIRVAGTAELAGFNLSIAETRKATLNKVLSEVFPDCADIAQAEYWCGLRPMTPDGTPVIGKTPYTNLYTNTGHGTLGWTMACGSGQLLCDLIEKRDPAIDPQGLDIDRYLN